MANTITTVKLQDNAKWAIIKYNLASDGSEEAASVLFDASAFTGGGVTSTSLSIHKITATLNGVSQGQLFFDADANLPAWTLEDGTTNLDFSDIGGIPNPTGSGKTGDILITTLGLVSGDYISIILKLKKK